jgi:hypothetical protein
MEIQERLNLLKAEGITQAENLEMAQRRALAELESQTGVEELGKNYKSLSQSLKNSTKNSTEWNQSMIALKKSTAKILNVKDWNSLSDSFMEAAESSGLLEKAAQGDKNAILDLRKASVLAGVALNNLGKSQSEIDAAIAENGLAGLEGLFEGASGGLGEFVENWNTVTEGMKTMDFNEFFNSDSM